MDGTPVHQQFPGSGKLMSGPPQWALPLSSEMACPKMSFQLAPESFWQADGLYIRTANLDSPPVSQTLQGLDTGRGRRVRPGCSTGSCGRASAGALSQFTLSPGAGIHPNECRPKKV